ncbi:hypothetical protein [Halomarina pelagica]|uniref:hypothetical protein n=1 Tax=Halomarina pelagica TaxID=2961599 RepID=UPI0020C3A271|nr:hypothetical protein [Halomarina sp. BND7]
MDTNGPSQGCRNGVTERPENGTFRFVNIVHFDELEVELKVEKGRNVERIVITSNGETIHTVPDVKAGRRTVTFAAEDATAFDIAVLNDDGMVIDTAQFYSRCSP